MELLAFQMPQCSEVFSFYVLQFVIGPTTKPVWLCEDHVSAVESDEPADSTFNWLNHLDRASFLIGYV